MSSFKEIAPKKYEQNKFANHERIDFQPVQRDRSLFMCLMVDSTYGNSLRVLGDTKFGFLLGDVGIEPHNN